MSQTIPQNNRRKQPRKKKRSLLPWELLFVLIAANVATFLALWYLLSGTGQTSDSFQVTFLLPEATLAAEPTPVATKVEVYLPTATVTVTPTPSQTPTPVPTLVPVSQPAGAATPTPPPVEEERVAEISAGGR